MDDHDQNSVVAEEEASQPQPQPQAPVAAGRKGCKTPKPHSATTIAVGMGRLFFFFCRLSPFRNLLS